MGTVDYSELYLADADAITVNANNGYVDVTATTEGPNFGATFNLAHLPSAGAIDLELQELKANETYIITSLGDNDGLAGSASVNDIVLYSDIAAAPLTVGQEFTMLADLGAGAGIQTELDITGAGISFSQPTHTLTDDIEAVQAKINTARVQAGSQYAALESAGIIQRI